jgi:CBS-domain-containing membrane protein
MRRIAEPQNPDLSKGAAVGTKIALVVLTPDHDLDDALKVMAREQVRRMPIVVRENQLVGMLAQADIAHATKEKTSGEVVEAISRSPGGPRVASRDTGGSPEARRHESRGTE